MSSTVGASSVEKQEWSCRIRRISCLYKLRGENISGVLYENNTTAKEILTSAQQDNELVDGAYSCSISNDFGRYYVIANNDGVDVEIKCVTNSNSCEEDGHKQVEIYAPDMTTNGEELTKVVRSNTEKKLKVYYYDLFTRSRKWGNTHPLLPTARIAGEIVDFVSIFRYLLLPRLTSRDTQFIYDLQYHDCYSEPNILLDVYPDIDFAVEIGFMGYNRSLEGGLQPSDTTIRQNFSFNFSVKYGSVEKKLDYESYLSLERQANNNLLYKTINLIGRFFQATGNFAESLSKEIEGDSHEGSSNLAKDLAEVGKLDKKVGKKLVRARRWLSGSISIQPKLSLRWHYDTSDDLRQLLRHIQLSLDIDCNGELRVDIIEIALQGVRKARTVTTAGALVVAISTGGLAAIFAAFIKLLIDTVVTWLVNKVKEGLKFNLVLAGKVSVQSLSYDSLRDDKIEGMAVSINPEIRLEIGVNVKTSITVFILQISGAVGGGATASTSLEWELKLNSKNGDLGIDHTLEITPFKLAVCVYALGGFEVGKSTVDVPKKSSTDIPYDEKISNVSSMGYGSQAKYEWSKEWTFKKMSCDIERWVLFKPDEKQ